MRKLIIAASALAFALPAAAQPSVEVHDEEIARALPKRGEIEAIGATIGAVTEAILNTPVGPLREAVEGRPLPGRERHETLGDLASRDDPYARERIRDDVATAAAGLGVAVEQFAVVAPVLRRSLEDAVRRMDEAMERRHGPPYEDRYEPRDGRER
jgi:hypothetical protein